MPRQIRAPVDAAVFQPQAVQRSGQRQRQNPYAGWRHLGADRSLQVRGPEQMAGGRRSALHGAGVVAAAPQQQAFAA